MRKKKDRCSPRSVHPCVRLREGPARRRREQKRGLFGSGRRAGPTQPWRSSCAHEGAASKRDATSASARRSSRAAGPSRQTLRAHLCARGGSRVGTRPAWGPVRPPPARAARPECHMGWRARARESACPPRVVRHAAHGHRSCLPPRVPHVIACARACACPPRIVPHARAPAPRSLFPESFPYHTHRRRRPKWYALGALSKLSAERRGATRELARAVNVAAALSNLASP